MNHAWKTVVSWPDGVTPSYRTECLCGWAVVRGDAFSCGVAFKQHVKEIANDTASG